ncbi:facilitated trehalose transporter Tret1-like [Schistocerca americana]|uniref:facilitated trehalose transporter Tret1-like n=1 Tax=Schistocerca americana TaxID=7009 RepID=UPI001F4F4D1D|nr:facilitated trehalose transporter Tret1-like [Schistocerca americana]XP_046993104.1 facilitated trehalose transporter Tret1-like [Schistocerca americana]
MDDTRMGVSTQTLVSVGGSTSSAPAKKLPQYIAAIFVTLGAMAAGTTLAWTSPANAELDCATNSGHCYTANELSWIGACMPLGAFAMVLPIGYLLDLVGRKLTMLCLVPPFVAGWACIVWGDTVVWLCVGRLLTGGMGGAFSLTAPVYTSEIAQKEIRGTLGGYYQLMLTVGILFVYLLGLGVELFWISIACGVMPILFAAAFIFMPETPLYRLKQGRGDEARKALQWFRGPHYDVEPELAEMRESVESSAKEKVSLWKAFNTPAARKGVLVAFGLMIFQQLSGVNAVIFYTSDIFKSAGSDIEPAVSTVIVGVMQVAATFVSSLVVDKLGRRILLLVSDSVMALCSLLLGIFFLLQDQKQADQIGWLPLVSMCLFIVVFSLGFGPIPWMMMSELFAPTIKGVASSVACLLNWFLAFIVTKFFSDMKDAFGSDVTFFIFAAISTLGTVFVFFIVPETKGKSLEEVQRVLGGEATEDKRQQVEETTAVEKF